MKKNKVESKPEFLEDMIANNPISDLRQRVEKLESLAHLSGDLAIFIVETPHRHVLIAADSFATVMMLYPDQFNIDYVGRASSYYKQTQVIREYPVRP